MMGFCWICLLDSLVLLEDEQKIGLGVFDQSISVHVLGPISYHICLFLESLLVV